MYRVMVVEDEELIRTMIRINLEKEGCQVTCFPSADDMLEHIHESYYDLIMLDLMMPGIPGDLALKKLREMGIQTPVIMVTAKNDIDTKIKTFDYGADDYISKPFNMKELIVRIKALIRRSQGERVVPSDRIIKIGDSEVNLDEHMAHSSRGEMVLSEREVKLLAYFNAHPGETLERSDILEEVWGRDVDSTPRTIDNYIVRFRKFFEEVPENPKHFLTVRSKGYRFVL